MVEANPIYASESEEEEEKKVALTLKKKKGIKAAAKFSINIQEA